MAATVVGVDEHVLADAKLLGHCRADRFDRATELVPGDARVTYQRIHAAKRAQIGAAVADHADPQQHVAVTDYRLADVGQ